jgi:hypothetical protein
MRSSAPALWRSFTALWNSALRSPPLQKSRSNWSVLARASRMAKALRKIQYQDITDTPASSSITPLTRMLALAMRVIIDRSVVTFIFPPLFF